jgi:hypothetical protein
MWQSSTDGPQGGSCIQGSMLKILYRDSQIERTCVIFSTFLVHMNGMCMEKTCVVF